MPKYIVSVDRTFVQFDLIEVEAENEAAAEDQVYQWVNDRWGDGGLPPIEIDKMQFEDVIARCEEQIEEDA